MLELTATVRHIVGVMSVASSRTHSVVIDRPTEKGGTDVGFLGGELLLAGEGGCLMSNLIAAATARGVELADVNITVTGQVADAPQRFSRIRVVVEFGGVDEQEAERLCVIARRSCIVSNTIANSADLEVVFRA